ncbi:MAG: hypothetical protein WD401_03905 [Thermomicrobiaceae bacterium]
MSAAVEVDSDVEDFELDSFELDSVEDEPPESELVEDDPLLELVVDPALVDERLSVAYQPEPLKIIPAG